MSRRQTVGIVVLGLIVVLGAFLRFYQLGAFSTGNAYYAATVQSMLTSWRNFFFVSFEPGGSVTVDKPPLGFWVQAASAYALGVNGFALALPQALAGVLSIPLLYALVKRQFSVWAGLFAALVLAITPVTVSTERNNTIDGLLLFVLLLAAWAFLRAVRKGRLRDLFLGAFLVGLGFNIKMLQAFLPLPAFYALYLLGAPHSWRKRLLHLGLATVVLIAVSLSWAVAVDLTPPENRPYVGSSDNNTMMELITGHNGLRRLMPMMPGSSTGNAGQSMRPPSSGPPGQPQGAPPPPASGRQPGRFQPNQPPQGPSGSPGPGNPRSAEVGEAGALRLFRAPLVTEAGWLLPLALLGIPLILVVLGWQWPPSDKHLALLLWSGWLLPETIYFSFTSGLFHAYYLIMLGPPLAALVGATAWAVWQVSHKHRWLGWSLLAVLTGGTLALQAITLQSYPDYATWVMAAAIVVWLIGMGLQAWHRQPWLGRVATTLLLFSGMVAPLTWSALTTFNTHPNVALPRAGPGTAQSASPNMPDTLPRAQQRLLAYLLDNTEPENYLVATLDARQAAPFILATGRPMLTFGGFTGSDNVVDADQLAEMVADGELRFVLTNQELGRQKREIGAWLANNCTTVTIPGVTQQARRTPLSGAAGPAAILYDCGNH